MKSQLSKAFEPALTSVEVLWQQFDDNNPKPIQVIFIIHNTFVCALHSCLSHSLNAGFHINLVTYIHIGTSGDSVIVQWFSSSDIWICASLSAGTLCTRGETMWVNAVLHLSKFAIYCHIAICDRILVKNHFIRKQGFSRKE